MAEPAEPKTWRRPKLGHRSPLVDGTIVMADGSRIPVKAAVVHLADGTVVVVGGEVAIAGTGPAGPIGPTSPEYDALVQTAMDLADERDRLRAVVEAFMNGSAGDLTEALTKLDRSGVMGDSPEGDLPYDAAAEHDYAMDLLARLTAAEAERDRLRAEVHRCGDLLAEWGSDLAVVRAERDRLRAVVDAVRPMWDDLTGVDDAGTHMQFPTVPHYDALERALDQLDVTGITGGGEGGDIVVAVEADATAAVEALDALSNYRCHHCGTEARSCLDASAPCCPDCHHGGAVRHRSFAPTDGGTP